MVVVIDGPRIDKDERQKIASLDVPSEVKEEILGDVQGHDTTFCRLEHAIFEPSTREIKTKHITDEEVEDIQKRFIKKAYDELLI